MIRSLCVFSLAIIAIQAEKIVNVDVGADGSQQEETATKWSEPLAIGIKIHNSRNAMLDYYWWNPDTSQGIFQGHIRPYGVTATNSYVGHIFYVTPTGIPDEEIFRLTVIDNVVMYIIDPDNEKDPHYLELVKEKKWTEDYQTRTGRPWLAHYPRDPPILHMWPADHIGQIHTVKSNESYWICVPENQDQESIEKCHPPKELEFKIEVIDTSPKAFKIMGTLSEVEADLIVDLSKPGLRRSLAGDMGGMETTTRTSKNTWLGRTRHFILETIYRRAADILNISHAKMMSNTEDLQVLRYADGQEYTSHHDFGANGVPQSRFVTLLFYLNSQASPSAGGETAFPKGNNGKGMAIHPGKGNSVMFYSLLEDGNCDDKSLHGAKPVVEGEKWLANFWVWDPHR